jgi:ABC-2 type transport system ATP-binding protein
MRAEPALRAAELLMRMGESVHLEADGTLLVEPGRLEDAELNRVLVEHGIAVSALHRERPSLETMFFDLTVDAALERAA